MIRKEKKKKQSREFLHPVFCLCVTSRFNAQRPLSLSVYNYRAANESSTNDRSTGSPD